MNPLKIEPKLSPAKKSVKRRAMSLYVIFFTLAVLFLIRILYLQYSYEGYELREEGISQRNREFRTIKAQRGSILSYDGKVLATTIPHFHIHMDFESTGFLEDSLESRLMALGEAMSAYFGDKSAEEYQENLLKWKKQGGLRYKRITPRRVNYLELEEVLKFPLLKEGRFKGGWSLDTLQYRALPYGDLASRTIGRTGLEGPTTGIELSLDSLLKGTDGVSLYQKVSGTFWMPLADTLNVEPTNGYNVTSTINIEVQDVAETMLRKQLTKYEAEWGTAILMDVQSGEIRALANLGRKNDGSYSDIYNYAIAKNMEPGSTYKLVNLLAFLDDCKLSIDKLVDCGTGTAYVSKAKIVDTSPKGVVTIRRMFEVSSNIGFAKTIYEEYGDNQQAYIDFIRSRGFDKGFNLGIIGETDPIIYQPGDRYWSGVTLPMMGYGYGLMMTPIHTLAIYNAIANDGVYVAPRIIHSYSDENNNIVPFKTDTIHPQVGSPSNIKEIRYTLEQVVNDGTAKVLLNENYKVAGKTGTAQVSMGRLGYHYNGGRNYLATMVGYFPADNPKYTCIVAMELFHKDGTSTPYYGGTLSGPVFRAIADKIYSQAVEWGNTIERPTSENIKAKKVVVREKDRDIDIKGGDAKMIQHVAKELGLPEPLTRVRGEYVVVDSLLRANIAIEKIERVTPGDSIETPDLRGLGLRDAINITGKMGIIARAIGSGQVAEQQPKQGEKISSLDTITLILK